MTNTREALPPLPKKRRAMFCTKCGFSGPTEAEASPQGAPCQRCSYTAFVKELDYSDDEMQAYARAALATQPAQPNLHPATADLVRRFSQALSEKLAAAEAKYGYRDGWASPDWIDECRTKLMDHIAKGDPRDVAAYCAFLWHHGASTAQPSAQGMLPPDPKCRHCRGTGVEELSGNGEGGGGIAMYDCTCRFRSRSAPAQPSAQGEAVAWLVEWKAHGHGPQWWGFNHTPGKSATWCSDANNAIRFARKEDAERMRLHIIAVAGLTGVHGYERSVSVTEHMWEGPCRVD